MFWVELAACRNRVRPSVSRYFKHVNMCSGQKLLVEYCNEFGDVTVLMLVEKASWNLSEKTKKRPFLRLFVCLLSL